LTIYDNHDNPFAKNTKPRKEQDANDGEEDDATGAVYLPGYLPQADQGAIIITTRSAEVNVGQFIHIGKLKDIDDCLRVLIPEAECAARTQGAFTSPSLYQATNGKQIRQLLTWQGSLMGSLLL
jgi:hypothetical protein